MNTNLATKIEKLDGLRDTNDLTDWENGFPPATPEEKWAFLQEWAWKIRLHPRISLELLEPIRAKNMATRLAELERRCEQLRRFIGYSKVRDRYAP